MRLQLTPAALTLTGAADADGQAATGDGADTPTSRRLVAGLAVPYETEAQVGGMLVTFAAGSVTFRDRAPLLLGHDPNQPIGVLAAAVEEPGGLRAAYTVDATPSGDVALIQAQSGSRAGLSVGVDVTRYEAAQDDPERIRVLEAVAVETSLVSLAAYRGAGVDTIAASQPPGGAPMPQDDQTEPAATDVDAIAERVAERVTAEQDRRRLLVAEGPLPERMRLSEYCTAWIRAQRGDPAARQRLEAALVRENVSTEQGLIPVAYVDQIIDSVGAARPLHDAFTSAEMPPAGMTIRRPKVTQAVDSPANTESRWLPDDTVAMPSGNLTIGNQDTPIVQWAFGGAASVALVERSQPSYVEEAFAQMLKAYYRDVEKKIAGALPSGASTVTTIGGAVAAFMAAYRDWPGLIVAGGDAYGKMIDATGQMRFSSGSVDGAGAGTIAGMRVVASPDVDPLDAWITAPDFLETRESSPLRLTVADVGGLTIEIGLTSFYAQTQTLAGVGAIRIAGYTPPAELLAARK